MRGSTHFWITDLVSNRLFWVCFYVYSLNVKIWSLFKRLRSLGPIFSKTRETFINKRPSSLKPTFICFHFAWKSLEARFYILIYTSVIPFYFFFAGATLIYVFYISCSLKFAETTANPLEIALLNIGCGSIIIQHLQHKYNVLELSLEMKIFLWHEMLASCNVFILLGYVGKAL